MEKLRIFRGEGAFARARSIADLQGLAVGGTFADGKPLYFLHPASATDDEVRDLAFVAVNGRRPDIEVKLLEMAEGLRHRLETRVG